MIKYLGSKRKLTPVISDIVGILRKEDQQDFFLDLFAGTNRVSIAVAEKHDDLIIATNDTSRYSFVSAIAHLGEHSQRSVSKAKELIAAANNVEQSKLISEEITYNYSQNSKYFQEKNALKVDYFIRLLKCFEVEKENLSLDVDYIYSVNVKEYLDTEYKRRSSKSESDEFSEKEVFDVVCICLTSIVEAACKVDSTVGLQMAYLKDFSARSYNNIKFELPKNYHKTDTSVISYNRDAVDVANLCYPNVSPNANLITYIDPPYNQHSYAGNYHIWDSISIGHVGEVYGKARKPIRVKNLRNPYNSKVNGPKEIRKVLESVGGANATTPFILSFSNEGFFNVRDYAVEISQERLSHQNPQGLVILSIPHDRHIGHKIGVYDNTGTKVGKETHSKNLEYLLISADKEKIEQISEQFSNFVDWKST